MVCVLRWRLVMQLYKLHTIQVFRAGNRAKHMEFGNAILRDMEDHIFLPCLIFSDEATFCISGKVNHYNV